MNAKLSMVLRILLGLILVIFGANHLYSFMPGFNLPKPAGDFFMAMVATGYFFKFVGITLIITGLLLLIKKWVPFALIVIATMALNMMLFHLFLAKGEQIGPATIVSLITILLIYDNWGSYKSLFT